MLDLRGNYCLVTVMCLIFSSIIINGLKVSFRAFSSALLRIFSMSSESVERSIFASLNLLSMLCEIYPLRRAASTT